MKKQMIIALLLAWAAQMSFAKMPNDNLKAQLLRYDYSQLLMENDFLGYIGNGQRLYMHFDTIYKDPVKPQYYHVEGKSKVKQNLCSFTGGITIHSFAPNEESDSLVKRYHLKAQYQLNEDANQRGSGFFAGRLTSDFFIYRDSICFDEMEGGEDGYNCLLYTSPSPRDCS